MKYCRLQSGFFLIEWNGYKDVVLKSKVDTINGRYKLRMAFFGQTVVREDLIGYMGILIMERSTQESSSSENFYEVAWTTILEQRNCY